MLDEYFEDKYTSGTSDDERFKDTRGEYHASKVSSCHRDWWWNFKREGEDTWSPYFELGRMFERMYGRALRWKHGEERVKQDVQFEYHLDDEITIVGESDWVVFEEGAERIEKVIVEPDGTRKAILESERKELRDRLNELRKDINQTDTLSGKVNNIIDDLLEYVGEPLPNEIVYDGQVEKVIETKTTKDVDWKLKYGYGKDHQYQLACYMMAFDAPGEIVYMSRNEADEATFEFERDEKIEMDIKIRAKRHHMNLLDDEPPDTNPMDPDSDCKWCEWRDECEELGGSRWD